MRQDFVNFTSKEGEKKLPTRPCRSWRLTQALWCTWQLFSGGEWVSVESAEETLQIQTLGPAPCGTSH